MKTSALPLADRDALVTLGLLSAPGRPWQWERVVATLMMAPGAESQ